MSSKAIMEKNEEWRPVRESAPSVVRPGGPTFARWVGFIGLMVLTVGVVAWALSLMGRAGAVAIGMGALATLVGLAALLFHSVSDHDLQVRRTYGLVGYLFLITGILVTLLPIKGPAGGQFLPWGLNCLFLGLLFLMT